MYNPISVSVVKQALKHSGLPTPTVRELSIYQFPDGTVTAEYLLTWTLPQIERLYRRPPHGLRDTDFAAFIIELQNAFVEDVTITAPTQPPLKGMYSLEAQIRCAPRPIQLAMFVDSGE